MEGWYRSDPDGWRTAVSQVPPAVATTLAEMGGWEKLTERPAKEINREFRRALDITAGHPAAGTGSSAHTSGSAIVPVGMISPPIHGRTLSKNGRGRTRTIAVFYVGKRESKTKAQQKVQRAFSRPGLLFRRPCSKASSRPWKRQSVARSPALSVATPILHLVQRIFGRL